MYTYNPDKLTKLDSVEHGFYKAGFSLFLLLVLLSYLDGLQAILQLSIHKITYTPVDTILYKLLWSTFH